MGVGVLPAASGMAADRRYAAMITRIVEKTSWYIERIAPAQQDEKALRNQGLFTFVADTDQPHRLRQRWGLGLRQRAAPRRG